MNKPLLSICCITYNHVNYISDAIEGFLSQKTNFPLEIIIHDDASTDGTIEIIKAYEEKYPDIITAIYQSENKYSKGIKPLYHFVYPKVNSKYIASCEGDDYWTDPYKLQKQVDEMEKYPDCYISFHPSEKLDEQTGQKTVVSKHYNRNKIVDVSEIIKGDGGYCPTASLCFRREVIDNIPSLVYDAPVGDYFLQVLGAVKGGALYINDCMSVYRVNSGNSWSDSMKQLDKKKKLLELFNKSIDDLNLYLNRKYDHFFKQRKAKSYLNYSIEFLRSKRFDEFKEYIVMSHSIYPKFSILSRFIFRLRFFPNFLYALMKFKSNLKVFY